MSWRENLLVLQVPAQHVVRVGRVAELELPRDITVETAAAQVTPRDAGLGDLDETRVVEVDRGHRPLRAAVRLRLRSFEKFASL